MFFIAGIQPKTTMVDKHARRCPRCGLVQAHEKRIDHYVSLFFIPILRVKKGERFVWCDRCDQPAENPRTGSRQVHCPHCGRRVAHNFRYCPHCGQPLG